MIVEIECIANPPGVEGQPYKHIEAAIQLIEESGLKYEVEPLGTTIEGDPDELWPLMQRVHEACLESGANSLVSVIKVQQTRAERPQPTIDSLTGKFRS